MKKMTFLLTILLLNCTATAEIYKWVDKNGITHYGSKKPLNKHSNNVSVLGNGGKSKKLTPKMQSSAKKMADEVTKDHGDAKKVNCSKAVSNAKSSIEKMLSVGKQNLDDGHMQKSQYTVMSAELKRIKGQISTSECNKASGRTLGFYKCMSNSSNHVINCGKKYNYGF